MSVRSSTWRVFKGDVDKAGFIFNVGNLKMKQEDKDGERSCCQNHCGFDCDGQSDLKVLIVSCKPKDGPLMSNQASLSQGVLTPNSSSIALRVKL